MKIPKLPAPTRLDKYLIELYPFTSRNYWREHLSEHVLIDGKRPKKGQRVLGGETLRVDPQPQPERPEPLPNSDLELSILFEDEFLFAVHKPAGLPCLPADSGDRQNLLSAVVSRYPDQAHLDPETGEGGLTHRLDNGTSGILLWAKQAEVKKRLRALHREGKIRKEYQAWVHGTMDQDGVISHPIAHDPKNAAKMRVIASETVSSKWKARPALTQYQILKTTEKFTLLRLGLSKGVRHQIRVHLAALGHPIVGDALYGSSVEFPLGRHLLHAHRLDFSHPETHQRMMLEAPLPQDFKP